MFPSSWSLSDTNLSSNLPRNPHRSVASPAIHFSNMSSNLKLNSINFKYIFHLLTVQFNASQQTKKLSRVFCLWSCYRDDGAIPMNIFAPRNQTKVLNFPIHSFSFFDRNSKSIFNFSLSMPYIVIQILPSVLLFVDVLSRIGLLARFRCVVTLSNGLPARADKTNAKQNQATTKNKKKEK